MGKLFRGIKKYTDEEFDNEELENEGVIEEELDHEDEIEIEDLESDAVENDEADEMENDSEGDSDDEDDSEDEEDSENTEDDSEDEEDSENAEDESENDEDDSEDEEDNEEDNQEDRREYRRRRRIRNQIIVYSVVLVILAVIIAGGMVVGKNVAGMLKEKKLAEEQAEMQEQLQAQQEAEAIHDVVIDAPEPIEIEPEPEIDHLGKLVEPYISEMPLEDKVAGLFIVTPEALTGVSSVTQAGEGTQEALNEYAVGGLIYFEKNIVSEEQLREMLSSTTSMSRYPIFLAVDEEGGSVSRVAESGIGVTQVPDMTTIGESGDPGQAYEAGLTIGTYLKDLGFNLDFAPVADVSGTENSVVGNRVFGSDAQQVADMVSNMVGGIEETGVSSCLKHFPGIGHTAGDTHNGRVEVTRTLDRMRGIDFIPFQAGIDAGADFVMVSHITVADAEGDAVPSTLSKSIMTDILRNELGFQGVIITDAMNMAAITEYYTTEEAAVKAIAAGADMLLMPDDFQIAYNAVLTAVQDGTISVERIDESLERIYRVKCAYMLEWEN